MKNQQTIEITDALIARYLSGEGTPEEAMALHAWLESRGHREHFERTERTWHITHPTRSPRPINRDTAWRSVHAKTGGNRESLAFPEEHHISSQRRLRTVLQIAASIIILLGAGFGAYFLLSEKEIPQVAHTTRQLPEERVLPDDSHVILNRHSTLRYTDDFAGKLREVTLSGEAFFTVTKNHEKPFVVHTAVADIRVVGTAFNVSDAHGDLEVSVSEGKVLVITKHDSSYLEAGHKGVIRAGISPITVTATADANVWAYATHRFTFKNTPLKEVLRYIEKSYPCTVELRNRTVANCRLNATFEDDSAENIVRLIAETLDLSFTHHGQTFLLDGKGCPP